MEERGVLQKNHPIGIPRKSVMNGYIPPIEEILGIDEPLPCRCNRTPFERHDANLTDARKVWIRRLNVKGYESHLSILILGCNRERTPWELREMGRG